MVARRTVGLKHEPEYLKTAGAAIVDAVTNNRIDDPEVFSIEGTPMVTQKTEDGKYKQKPGIAGQEFFMHDAYVGARADLIFILKPVDSQDYEHIEVPVKKMDVTFRHPSMIIAGHLKMEPSAELDTAMIVAKLYGEAMSQGKAVEKAEAKAKLEDKLSKREVYSKVPNFGRF